MLSVNIFNFSSPRRIIFEPGAVKKLGEIAAGFGKNILVVRAHHLTAPARWNSFHSLHGFHTIEVKGEPSPEMVDAAVKQFGEEGIALVISIGGGSVIDAGKAISAMLPLREPVADYLEDVGRKIHPGIKIPFIAVPTTAGTGSEASANTVLSRVGPRGFKKSLRHINLIPDVALIDPELALSCPPSVSAACGMDAFTQLLEAYVSPLASQMTDVLVESALPYVRDCLVPAATDHAADVQPRAGMAYASLISGIALANAGLGVVHGMASPIGAYFPVPHGVVCGTLVGKATEVTIKAVEKTHPSNPFLKKYARVGSLISGKEMKSIEGSCCDLVATISGWAEMLRLPLLSKYGITENDIEKIAAGTSNKNNPATLSKQDIAEIILSRI